jgi:hypothetical protein
MWKIAKYESRDKRFRNLRGWINFNPVSCNRMIREMVHNHTALYNKPL